MTQSTPERMPCGTCGNEYTVTANKTIRHHTTNKPEFQADPDSRKCKGAGQPPAGPAGVALAEDMAASGPQCRLCRHPVELTSNGRVRSHRTPEATPRPCPGGSDFPLGTYPDMAGTTDGLVASLAVDCGHVPAGQCYDCWDAEPAATAKPLTETAPWGVAPETVTQPTMADQFKATPLTEALARETAGVGTVLDFMDADTRTQAERFMAAGVPEQPTARVEHVYTDPSGVKWAHPGTEDACRAPDCRVMRAVDGDVPVMDQYGRIKGGGVYCEKCDTDSHRCPGCGAGVSHGVVACDDCERELLGRKLPPGRTEDGRPCEHREAMFGVENGRMVCVACGMPCTHPDGFTENDPEDDDGEGLIFTCVICGLVDPGDDPGCPTPETHRAGCGCPDDDSARREPPDGWRTPLDLMEKMPEVVRGLDALRLNCGECGHPVTPLVDHFAPDGSAAKVVWACENHLHSSDPCRGHECEPNRSTRLGDLDEGDHFTRRGVLMRVKSAGYGLVEAVVLDGPHKGRTGELKNPDERVDREPCRHDYAYADDGQFGHSGMFCNHCGKEPETQECTDDRTATRQPRSSAGATTRKAAAPDPGLRQPTAAPAPVVSPKSESVTPSAPTARAVTNSRGAALTADQSAAAAAFLSGGRPAATAPAGTQDQAAAAAQFLAGGSGTHGEKETKRDRFGRYLLPHPDTGKETAWTRSTTFAKSISDTYALSQWGLRMALLGATVRPDIVKRAHGKHVRADKALLDDLTAELKTAAGDKVAANLGTAMHSFTEMADRAWHSPGGARSVLAQVPEDCREMVETYIRLLEETGLEPVPHLIEFTTVVKQYGVAGTSDNCYKVTKPLALRIGRGEVRLSPGEYVIGDKKTGRDLDYGWQEIAIQLATYGQGLNTAGVWDRDNEVWDPDPLSRFDAPGTKVRLDAGIVIHLPVDEESEKQPAVYGVDLESGWNAAVLCERVRAWRKVRKLASPVMVSEADTFAPSRTAAQTVRSAPMAGSYDPDTGVTSRTTVRPPTLKDRAQSVTSNGEASAVWKDAKKAGLPDSEVDELVSVMKARLKKLAEPGG